MMMHIKMHKNFMLAQFTSNFVFEVLERAFHWGIKSGEGGG